MKTEDIVFTHLFTRYPDLLATAIEGIEARHVTVLPLPLPTVRKLESDFAVKVLRPGPRHVLHAEHWSVRGDLARTCFYHMWYHEAARLPVRTVIVTTSPRLARAVPREYAFRVAGGRPTRVPLDCLHLWRISARSVLDRGQVVLYPFVPLMRDARPGRVLMEELRARIIEQCGEERDRLSLLAAAYYIAARRFDEGMLGTVFGGLEEMAKTDLGQKLIEKGRQEGRQEGHQEGRQEGEVVVRRRTLLRQMRQKFGTLPSEVETRVEKIDDVARLDELLSRILTAASIAEMGLA